MVKGFQLIVQNYLTNHEKHKKYIALVLALSMLVFCTVPFGLMKPATSMTTNSLTPVTEISKLAFQNSENGNERELVRNYSKTEGNIVDNIIYSPEYADLITLLFGSGDNARWMNDCTTVEQALTRAKSDYFLGLASDFCAFIEEDFTVYDADAEGRIAVGGNISFNNSWNYQIGCGDYSRMTALLETDNYADSGVGVNIEGIFTGYAHVLCGGKLYRINTLSTGIGRNGDSSFHKVNKTSKPITVYYPPEEDLYKRLIVGNVKDSLHYTNEGEDAPYTSNHSHEYPADCGDNCQHDYLGSVNELAQMYEYPKIKNIIASVFSDVRSRSAALSKMKGIDITSNGNTIHFKVPDNITDVKTVYFNLDQWTSPSEVYFENIPEGANIIVNCGGEVINIDGNVRTLINGTTISKLGTDDKTNNNAESQRILYNFYEAVSGEIKGNFNGTILSPNADWTAPTTCPGHLSGAMIAKSFEGGLEFGYRPYRGESSIVGLASGYAVPVDKIFEGTTGNDEIHVSMARMSADAFEGDTFTENTDSENVFTWLSNGKTQFIPLPSLVDFSGETDYSLLEPDSEPEPESEPEPDDSSGDAVPPAKAAPLTISKGKLSGINVAGGLKHDEEEFSEEPTEAEETVTTEDIAEDETIITETALSETVTDETISTENISEITTETVSEEAVTETTSAEETDEEEIIIDAELPEEKLAEAEIILNDDETPTEPRYHTFKQKYVIRETEAPEGFFRTETKYYVDIEEKLNIDTIISNLEDGRSYPNNVETTIRISDDENNEKSSWKILIDDGSYYGSDVKRRIISITDAEGNIIREFAMDANSTNCEVEHVYLIGANDELSDTDLFTEEELGTAHCFTIGDNDYYYDPDFVMIMPIPSNNLKFENKPGLLFKKVDTSGNVLVKEYETNGDGVRLLNDKGEEIVIENAPTIQLIQGNNIKITFDEGSRLFDIFDTETYPDGEYVFHESDSTDKYIAAPDIHFILTDNRNSIEYWSEGDSEHSTLDLTKNREIRMVDGIVYGAELSLQKYSRVNDTEEILDGAKFSLYSGSEKFICSGLDGNGNIFDNPEFKALTNSYARDGYLKPGVYYLVEEYIPDYVPKEGEEPSRYVNQKRIYFTVDDDYYVHEGYKAVVPLEKCDFSNNVLCLYDENGCPLNDKDNPTPGLISGVISFTITTESTFEQFYATDFGYEEGKLTTISHTYDEPVDLDNFKIQCWSSSLPTIISVEIVTAYGAKYTYKKDNPDEPSGYTFKKDTFELVGEVEEISSENPHTGAKSPVKMKFVNVLEGETTDITVKKNWAGDKDFADVIRPDSIEVQLYRSTVKDSMQRADSNPGVYNAVENSESDTAVGEPVVLNKDNNWQKEWTELPAYDNSTGEKVFYYYYVKETKVGDSVPENSDYDVSYSTDSEGNLIVTNTLKSLKLKARKDWYNGNLQELGINEATFEKYQPENVVVKLQWYVPVTTQSSTTTTGDESTTTTTTTNTSK